MNVRSCSSNRISFGLKWQIEIDLLVCFAVYFLLTAFTRTHKQLNWIVCDATATKFNKIIIIIISKWIYRPTIDESTISSNRFENLLILLEPVNSSAASASTIHDMKLNRLHIRSIKQKLFPFQLTQIECIERYSSCGTRRTNEQTIEWTQTRTK